MSLSSASCLLWSRCLCLDLRAEISSETKSNQKIMSLSASISACTDTFSTEYWRKWCIVQTLESWNVLVMVEHDSTIVELQAQLFQWNNNMSLHCCLLHAKKRRDVLLQRRRWFKQKKPLNLLVQSFICFFPHHLNWKKTPIISMTVKWNLKQLTSRKEWS